VVVDFVSRYEVWVYRRRLRDKAPPASTEFVLLFAPSGMLAKTASAEHHALAAERPKPRAGRAAANRV
jgi:hypothetical protein